MKSKKIISIIAIVALFIGVICITLKNKENIATNLEKTNGITFVPTMNDKITADSSWCGTFQLV